jgi:VIT1/CCC1 family predicted Fe2+/Mn2+ transporter
MLEKAGVEGRYQVSLGVIMSLVSYLTGGMMLITPYLFYQDPYICTN